MPLEFVQPQPGADINNLIIYGPPGQGKTTAACSAPGPILYLNCEGPSRLKFARRIYGDAKIHELTVTGRATIDAAYLHLTGGGDEQTVVVDSMAELYRILLADIAKDDMRPTHPEHGDVQTIIRRFVDAMRHLPQVLILVCHEDFERDDSTGEIIHRPMTGGKKLPSILSAMVDVVAYASLVEQDNGDLVCMAQLAQAKGRQAKWSGPSIGAVSPIDIEQWIQLTATDSAATGSTAAANGSAAGVADTTERKKAA